MTKKELIEENKQLKEELKVYRDFWETDAIKECLKQLTMIKKIITLISILLLMLSMFLFGMSV